MLAFALIPGLGCRYNWCTNWVYIASHEDLGFLEKNQSFNHSVLSMLSGQLCSIQDSMRMYFWSDFLGILCFMVNVKSIKPFTFLLFLNLPCQMPWIMLLSIICVFSWISYIFGSIPTLYFCGIPISLSIVFFSD